MKLLRSTIAVAALLLVFIGCEDPEMPSGKTDNFDRSLLLTEWVDGHIVPATRQYAAQALFLKESKDEFLANPSEETLLDLRNTCRTALLSWQEVSMFDIGMAESISFRSFTNIFPTTVSKINENIMSGSYELALPSNIPAQGFPALDYLLSGMENANFVDALSTGNTAVYLSAVVDRLEELARLVNSDWTTGYRETFIAADGSSATSSTDKMINDYIFYFERFLRSGKVGIPAGIFSGVPIATSVETPYQGDNRIYLERALRATKRFFTGSKPEDVSIKSYLDELSDTGTSDLAIRIEAQFDVIALAVEGLDVQLQQQVEQDNSKMVSTYEEMQKLVVLLKVDMLQALNIQVDYVDADGD